jgi:hypothetical protein
MKIQDEESEKQHKCLCSFETIRIKSMISQYHGDSQGSEILAREAYEGFKATLGPSYCRTLFACTGYLSTLTPSSSKDELASVTALEFERIAGAEANITRYAQYMSSSIYLLHEDPDFAVNRFHAMLEPNIKKGLFSYDQRIPILDEPTLRIMIDLGWANIRAYIKHEGEDQPPIELLSEAKDLGERVFRGSGEVVPFISSCASNLVGEAFFYLKNLSEAEHWFKITTQLVQTEGSNTLVSAKSWLEEIARLRQLS